jgi:hypothetical protein
MKPGDQVLAPALPAQQFHFAPDAPQRDIDACLTAQPALVALLVRSDDRTKQILRTSGGLLTAAAEELAAFSETFARECGWRGRGHMFTKPDAVPDAVVSAHPRCEEFLERSRTFPWHRLLDVRAAIEELVFTTWALPRDHPRERWTWLPDDLIRAFSIVLVQELEDRNQVLVYSLRPTPHVPDLHFTQAMGESVSAARQRLRNVYEEADQLLAAEPRVAATPTAGGTLLPPAEIRRNVIVFYLRHLIDPPKPWSTIAREIGRKGDQRKKLKQDDTRARRLLSEIRC